MELKIVWKGIWKSRRFYNIDVHTTTPLDIKDQSAWTT